jgi:hypothetical protein
MGIVSCPSGLLEREQRPQLTQVAGLMPTRASESGRSRENRAHQQQERQRGSAPQAKIAGPQTMRSPVLPYRHRSLEFQLHATSRTRFAIRDRHWIHASCQVTQ